MMVVELTAKSKGHQDFALLPTSHTAKEKLYVGFEVNNVPALQGTYPHTSSLILCNTATKILTDRMCNMPRDKWVLVGRLVCKKCLNSTCVMAKIECDNKTASQLYQGTTMNCFVKARRSTHSLKWVQGLTKR